MINWLEINWLELGFMNIRLPTGFHQLPLVFFFKDSL